MSTDESLRAEGRELDAEEEALYREDLDRLREQAGFPIHETLAEAKFDAAVYGSGFCWEPAHEMTAACWCNPVVEGNVVKHNTTFLDIRGAVLDPVI